MADPPSPERYAELMRAELDWAPLHFDGWTHYETARPALAGETTEILAAGGGHVVQYRPLLGELTAAHQTPIDPAPLVTVLGRIRPEDADTLRALAARAGPEQAAAAAAHLPTPARRIVEEPAVPTGSIAPGHATEPVHYHPADSAPVPAGRLVADDHPSAAYAVAGHWGLRLGPPVGLTPTGLLVFEPPALDGARITVEHPATQPVTPHLHTARLGIYRPHGLGTWDQVATLHTPDELTRTGVAILRPTTPTPRPGPGQSTRP